MSKRIKDLIISDLRQRIGDCRDMLVVDYSELDGGTANTMRNKLRKQNIRMLGVKNSLARRALSDIGLKALEGFLAGPSALVYGGADIVALSKEIAKWAKDIDKLKIKGGMLDGAPISKAEVDSLSKSPSREELLGRVVMLMLSPGASIGGALLGSGGTLVGQFKSLAEKQPDAAPAAAS
jgi:large subunit ribosomal protein L10